METIWCEIEEGKVLRGKCLHDKGGTIPNNRTCSECSYFKSLFPIENISLKKAIKRPIVNKNPSKKSPVQALLKAPFGRDDKSVPFYFKALKEQYEEKKNPIPLMHAFTTGYYPQRIYRTAK